MSGAKKHNSNFQAGFANCRCCHQDQRGARKDEHKAKTFAAGLMVCATSSMCTRNDHQDKRGVRMSTREAASLVDNRAFLGLAWLSADLSRPPSLLLYVSSPVFDRPPHRSLNSPEVYQREMSHPAHGTAACFCLLNQGPDVVVYTCNPRTWDARVTI